MHNKAHKKGKLNLLHIRRLYNDKYVERGTVMIQNNHFES